MPGQNELRHRGEAVQSGWQGTSLQPLTEPVLELIKVKTRSVSPLEQGPPTPRASFRISLSPSPQQGLSPSNWHRLQLPAAHPEPHPRGSSCPPSRRVPSPDLLLPSLPHSSLLKSKSQGTTVQFLPLKSECVTFGSLFLTCGTLLHCVLFLTFLC